MTQVSSERNNNSGGDTLLEIISIPEFNLKVYDPNLIGPRDASDDGRGLLLRQIEDVARIAVADVVSSPKYHADLVTKVNNEIASGHLRLSSDYPQLDAHDQTMQFIMDNFEKIVLSPDEVRNDIIAENVVVIRTLQEAVLENNGTIEKLKKDCIQAQLTILRVRQGLRASNISDAQLAVFDENANIAAPSEISDEEDTKSPTGKFWNIVRQLSQKTFETIGIVAPKSAEVTVIKQREIISSNKNN